MPTWRPISWKRSTGACGENTARASRSAGLSANSSTSTRGGAWLRTSWVLLFRVADMVRQLEPTAEALGCVDYLQECLTLAAGPSGADRQLSLLRDHPDPADAIRRLTARSRLAAA